jgi:hypothetical protein
MRWLGQKSHRERANRSEPNRRNRHRFAREIPGVSYRKSYEAFEYSLDWSDGLMIGININQRLIDG